MKIPFTKAHGHGNDFLLTPADAVRGKDGAKLARAICDRHTGIGADGWMLVDGHSIHLFNSDGSEAEMSGNGTRCAAALFVSEGASGEIDVMTGAGPKHLSLLERSSRHFVFEMDMGKPVYRKEEIRYCLPLASGAQEVTIVHVGTPQCVLFVEEFPAGWQRIAAEVEGHAQFPKRTNVSFVRVADKHSIEVRFYERGAGETLSSGTGSTGAAVAAILRGLAQSPVHVVTAAGPLSLRWDESVHLTGSAVLIGSGEFYAE